MPIAMVPGSSAFDGMARRNLPRAASKSPTLSAMPAPSMTTTTMPRGWKWANVWGISENRRRRFSALKRFWANTSSPLPGRTAVTPAADMIALTIMTMKQSAKMIVTASGAQ